jgi:hypothetical protein
LETNKDKCPEWYNPEKHPKKKGIVKDNEVANTAMNRSGLEILLSAMDYESP